MNTATIVELAYLIKQAKDKGLPKPIVFLGAGASKTGGVPLANEIVNDILEKYKGNPKVKLLHDDCKTYKKLMECLTPYERNELLNEYIDKAKINVTHIYLAQLLHEGYIDYVLTVNFDNLMLRALALFNNFPPTYDLSNLKDLTTSSFKEKSVVYLHGQHHGLWLLNTDEEMAKVNEVVPPILNSIKNQRPWIFIGYSGEDPIFKHITKLGSFANGLYWVTYQDNNPNDSVCSDLLEKPLTNAFLIKGYDADSFMLKLSAELKLPQPQIIDKPFTSIRNTLENIVDIDDKEHFKGVKERLEIAKKDMSIAIKQFEEGKIVSSKDLKEEIDINLLKKQIIDKIIKRDFNQEFIKMLEKKAAIANNTKINFLISSLFSDWGNTIFELAKSKNNIELYEKSFEKYQKATELNPKNYTAFYNWGIAICGLANLKNDEMLYIKSFEKYKKATEINPKDDSAFNNWGTAISELAFLKNDEALYYQCFEKFQKAIELNPKYDLAFQNWGSTISDLANLKNDEMLYIKSFEKFQKATEINPKNANAFYNWGNAIYFLAKLKKDILLYEKSFDKYRMAIEINPKKVDVFINWGNAIYDLAVIKNDESLYLQSIEKYKSASELNPKDHIVYNNWGNSISGLAKLKNDEELFEMSIEKINKAVKLGGHSYNLACVYAKKKDKIKALEILENCLKKKEIETIFVEKDEDWKEFLNDADFIALIKKYKEAS